MWRLPFFLLPYLAAGVEWLLYARIARPGRRAAAAWGAVAFLAASKNPLIWLCGGYWFNPDMPTWLFALLNGLEGCLWTGLPCFLAASVVALVCCGRIKHPCPCCGCYTYDGKPGGSFSACPVCFWEDDPVQLEDETYKGGANEVCLAEARENYKKFGACEERFAGNVRKPRKEELSRRRGRGRAFAVAALVAAGLAAYGIVEGVRVPSVAVREVWFADLPEEFDGYRLVHLSDLHCSSVARRWKIEGIVRRVNALDADAVAITGDFVDGAPEIWARELEPIRGLSAKDGVFASTGNHERYWGFAAWEPLYREWGVRFLRNESVEIRRGGAVLALGGLDDPELGSNPGAVFAGRGPDDFRVLMFHRPIWCARLAEEFGVRLQLSGHTHGGGTPGLDRLVANANEGHLRGLYREGPATLHVSPGSGQWGGYPLRFFDPAEITLLVLRRSPEARPKN